GAPSDYKGENGKKEKASDGVFVSAGFHNSLAHAARLRQTPYFASLKFREFVACFWMSGKPTSRHRSPCCNLDCFRVADYPLAERFGMRSGVICYRTFLVTAGLAIPCGKAHPAGVSPLGRGQKTRGLRRLRGRDDTFTQLAPEAAYR